MDKLFAVDFLIDNGVRHDKHHAIVVAKDEKDAKEKILKLNSLLKYDENIIKDKINIKEIPNEKYDGGVIYHDISIMHTY